MKNPLAAPYVDGFALHWYNNKNSPAGLLDTTRNEFPDQFILATEACSGM